MYIGSGNKIKNSTIRESTVIQSSGSIYQDCDSDLCKEVMNSIIANRNGKIVINGQEIEYPNKECRNVTIINNSIFVDGLEYKDGEWKRTLRALWHKWF